jgi:multidrug efflux pump subunit AcrA (membrane-fusion protein)
MLAITLIGRGVDSVTLPVVKTSNAQNGPLKHIAEMSGILTPREEIPVNTRSGLTVSRVLVRAGQQVKAGEKLVEFDVSRLSKLLSQKQADLSKRKLQSQLDAIGDQSAGAPQDGKEKPKDVQQDPSAKQKATLKSQIASLEIASLQSDVDELNSILYSGACATAPEAGTITEVIAKPGDLTQEGALLRLAPAEGGLVARASLDADPAKILISGAAATYMLSGDTKYRDGASVLDIKSSEGGYSVSVALPDGEGMLGQAVTVRVEQDTGYFDMRVPIGALTAKDGTDGVFRIRDGQSVLGAQEYAEFVPVSVLDKDMRSAAVDGALRDTDQIIVSSSKPLRDGDRVRSAL